MKECPACRRCFPDEINHCPQDGDATTPSLIGEPILDARYQLERRLGQGGMGVVFQARHIFLKTSHAIKVILPDLVGNDPMLVTRFRQEALAAAAIRHQNIIAVTDFGVVRGTMPFLVMEFVNGKSLQDILAVEKTMSAERALEFASAIGAGVSAAHRQNIVHRDLKPLNIMTQTGQSISEGLKILDFGLAKIKSGELLGSFVQAKTSGLMGSPFYMAPEQWSDEEPDARADIYSLGIILYQMLSGDVPFKGNSIPAIMKKHLTLPPPSFASVGVDVAPRIEAVVYHALEKDPAARIPTVDAFIAELKQAVAAEGSTMRAGRQTLPPELDRTLFEPSPDTAAMLQQTTAESALDSVAGTVSSAALSPAEKEKISASRIAFEREQQEKDRVAREELAREAEARRKAEEEKERKRKEQEERVRKEQEDREERERQQREQMERVERQARELEERLAKLATSISPGGATVADLEATQVGQGASAGTVANNSLPGVAPGLPQSGHKLEVSIPAAAKPKSNMLVIGGIGLIVLLLVGSVAGYFVFKSSPVVTNGNIGKPPASPEPTAPPRTTQTEVLIPGGTFEMGRNDGEVQEQPEHHVTVPAFYMDVTEVTNAEYGQFIRENPRYPYVPEDWVNRQPLPEFNDFPVTNVSFRDAEEFAKWRSKRDRRNYQLPTEEQWEYAARSRGVFKLYPWGDDWGGNRAATNIATARPVGSYPEGKSQEGILDLIGNVWEWTSSKISAYPGNPNPIKPSYKNKTVVRGCDFECEKKTMKQKPSATTRQFTDPSNRQPIIGFRLVRSAE